MKVGIESPPEDLVLAPIQLSIPTLEEPSNQMIDINFNKLVPNESIITIPLSSIEERVMVSETLAARMPEQEVSDVRPKIAFAEVVTREVQQVRGGRGRGPCPGCMAQTEDGHHGGSKCSKRGQRIRTAITAGIRINKVNSIMITRLRSSGLN